MIGSSRRRESGNRMTTVLVTYPVLIPETDGPNISTTGLQLAESSRSARLRRNPTGHAVTDSRNFLFIN